MKILFLFFAAIGIPGLLPAQDLKVVFDSSKKAVDFSGQANNAEIQLPSVKNQPEYPGGRKAWQDFLRSNINIAVPFANKAIQGNHLVMIRFIVGSDGKVSGVGSDSNCGYGMESEVIRCIQKSPEWIPAETASGKQVRFILRQLVSFNVKANDIGISFP
jgi:hypothetical protein